MVDSNSKLGTVDDDYQSLPSESSSVGEKIDYTETEEDESYDESDEEDEESPKRKRTKRSAKKKKPRFVDIEAEVGDEDEEEYMEEDEDDEFTKQFIDDNRDTSKSTDIPDEDEDEEDGSNIDRYRALAQRQAAEEIDVAAEEARLKQLYGKVHHIRTSEKGSQVPAQFLLPTVTDPKLWLVRCKLGKERAAVHQMLKYILDSQLNGQSVSIFSATALDTLKGYIYVEANKPSQVAEAVEKAHIAHWLFCGGPTGDKIVLVPLNEMTDVLKFDKLTKVSSGELTMPELGDFVRAKRGKYAQDLAQVIEVPEEFDPDNLGSVIVKIKILPRINYRTEGASSVQKGKSQDAPMRPPARLFDQHEAAKYGSVTKSRGYWIFAGETYKDGFLHKDVRLSSLITDLIRPTKNEKELLGIVEDVEEDNEEQSSGHIKTSPFQIGERVMIKSGDLRKLVGTIESLTKGDEEESMASIRLETSNIPSPVNIPLAFLERIFKLGDEVRVLQGDHIGQSGMIVDIEKKTVTIYTGNENQISVPKGDIQLSRVNASEGLKDETGGVYSFRASTKFSIYDVVQVGGVPNDFGIVTNIIDSEGSIQLIDANGNTRTESIENLTKTQSSKRNDSDLKEGQRVLDENGDVKVLVAYHNGVAFLRKVDGGSTITIHSLNQLRREQSSEPVYKPVAPRYASGGMALLGKSVSINGGPYKGYIGIVKEIQESMARVELHTNSKIISIDRERLSIVGSASDRLDDNRYRDRNMTGMTPSVAIGKTPAWGGAAAASGKTPAWGAATGKTPAWNVAVGKTPAWSSTTPTWNAKAGATGKTPSWAQSKTPSWQQPQTSNTDNKPIAKPVISSATWAIQNAEVMVSGEKFKITATSGPQITVASAKGEKTVSLSDASPCPPSKKDRVAIHNITPVLYGSVIGLDGPDAVVKVDGTGEFKIVNVSSLVKIAP